MLRLQITKYRSKVDKITLTDQMTGNKWFCSGTVSGNCFPVKVQSYSEKATTPFMLNLIYTNFIHTHIKLNLKNLIITCFYV